MSCMRSRTELIQFLRLFLSTFTVLCGKDTTISIFHGCMLRIEKSFTRVTDRHHESFKRELATKYIFPLKSFYSSLKRPTLPATAVLFFNVMSNLHKLISLFSRHRL